MQRLYLVRHGETEHNAHGILQGGLDSPLTERGEQQARDAALWLADHAADIGVMCTSPLGRARKTLDIMRDDNPELAALPVLVEPRLGEARYGTLEGHTLDDLPEDPWMPGEAYRAHGGDTQAESSSRIVCGLARIMREHPDSNVLAISHGTVMGLFWVASERGHSSPPPLLDNGSILVFEFDDAREVFIYRENAAV